MARSPKNNALGRGLGALFADRAPVNESIQTVKYDGGSDENRVLYIDINNIKPNVNQPRKNFDEEKIDELAASITEHGIIQPLVVRSSGATFEIVAGERRWRAARKAGLKNVPCIVKEFTDEENMLIAMIENLQREDLDPIEEAQGLEVMIRHYGLTQEELSKSVSKSRPYISNALRLLKLPEEVQDLVSQGLISGGHARAIIGLSSKEKQLSICRKIIAEGLSVRDVEALVSGAAGKKRAKPRVRVKDPDTARMEERLKAIYGTKVLIENKGKKGTITLENYSSDERDRILDMLVSG